MKRSVSSLIVSLFIFNLAYSQPAKELSKPVDLNDGIHTSTLAAVGMNASVISKLLQEIESGVYPNRHSLLIYKNGKLVVEKYFTGKDEKAWTGDLGIVTHTANTLHDLRSVTKSVVAACIGIAIGQGKIKSVNQKLFEFFPEYVVYDTGAKKNLTLEHLLTMSSGLRWNEEVPYDNPDNSEIQMSSSKDPIAFILSREIVTVPGTEWKYNGGTTQLLAEIVKRATGKSVADFANENMFKKIGIKEYEWAVFPGTNNPIAASGLRLKTRDILKFGILYKNNGQWDGQQVLPASWVEQSFQSKVVRSKDRHSDGGYGYQFWIFRDSLHGKTLQLPAAVGNGDQRILFDKDNDLLVVMTAGNYNKWNIPNNSAGIMRRIYESFDFVASR
jgi:CubicO group peptidase (beta-lactamase class C family)